MQDDKRDDILVDLVRRLAITEHSRRGILGAVGKVGLGVAAVGSGLLSGLPVTSSALASGPDTIFCCDSPCSTCDTGCTVGHCGCTVCCGGCNGGQKCGCCFCSRAYAHGCMDAQGHCYCTPMNC